MPAPGRVPGVTSHDPIQPEPEPEPGAASPSPAGPVRLVFDDGTVADLPADEPTAQRLAYLVDNLLPPDKGEALARPPAASPADGGVRLVFADGRVEDLAGDPDTQAQIAYLVDNILEGSRRKQSQEPGRED